MATARLRLFLVLAARGLYVHKVSSLIVGSIIFFGTFLVVVGSSVLDAVDHSMAQSVVASVAGNMQVYSSRARDKLALFGSGFMGIDDIGEIADFRRVKESLSQVPNVRAVVPMGIGYHTVSRGNDVDRAVHLLRRAAVQKDSAGIAAGRAQIVTVSHALAEDLTRTLSWVADKDEAQKSLTRLQRVQSDAFWEEFAVAPDASLDFLETRIANLAEDETLIYLRNLGTDITQFSALFDRFEVVEGERVPDGHRGFMFSKRFYEERIKNKVARELDRAHRDITVKQKSIASDPVLKDHVQRLSRMFERVVFDLLPGKRPALTEALATYLHHPGVDLETALKEFLTLDDSNFIERYAYFYAHIAPAIRLYQIPIGSILTLRGLTKSGYLRSANVRVYGTFTFKGLESSDLSGAQNLIDLQTFRDLYGFMTVEKKAELAAIKQEVGAADINREDAEQALFGQAPSGLGAAAPKPSGNLTQGTADQIPFDEFADNALAAAEGPGGLADTFDAADIDRGIAMHAAILLHNPESLAKSMQAVREKIAADKLELTVVDWQSAAGMIGQFIVVARLVLYVAVSVIFLVALVIINNAMVMNTTERITEIGTMRALGANKRFVLGTVFYETLTLGGIAGTLGALAGGLLVFYLQHAGIKAWADFVVFFFSGPRLYPHLAVTHVLTGFGIILLVSLISAVYPAHLASRILPVVAMQAKE